MSEEPKTPASAPATEANDYNFVIDPAHGKRTEHIVTLENGPVIEKTLRLKSADEILQNVAKGAEKFNTKLVRVWKRGHAGAKFTAALKKDGYTVIELGA